MAQFQSRDIIEFSCYHTSRSSCPAGKKHGCNFDAEFSRNEVMADRAEQVSHLSQREIAEMLVDSVQHREKRGDWHIFEFVLMASHIHLFFQSCAVD